MAPPRTGSAGTGSDQTTYNADSLLGFKLTASTSTSDLAVIAANIDTAITNITKAGAVLGSTKTNIDNQSTVRVVSCLTRSRAAWARWSMLI